MKIGDIVRKMGLKDKGCLGLILSVDTNMAGHTLINVLTDKGIVKTWYAGPTWVKRIVMTVVDGKA